MKQLLLFTLSLLVTVGSATAQKIDYDNSSKWFLGVNVGGAWQTTDVKNQMGSGWGLTLGRSYNYNYGKALYFDIRARYLGGKWYGQDYSLTDLTDYNPDNADGFPLQPYKDAQGLVVNNFQTEVHRLGLELVLHANGIRERTGWDPYIFGGIGLTWHQTYGDLYFADSTVGIYDYASLGDNINSTTISGLNDGIYETALTGSEQNSFAVGVMPSLGFGLGYQIGKRVTLGVEHKTTFTGLDHFDGFHSAAIRDKQDLYHYTSLYLQFRFRTGNRGGGGSSVNNIDNYNTNTNNLTNCDLPVIRITDPVTGTQLQGGQIYTVRAEINRINGRDKITFLHNGVISNNFTYDPTSGRVESQVLLAEGTNTFEFRAFNSCGNVTQSVSINYQNCTSPIANWTNPISAGNVVMQPNYTVQAQMTGVGGRENIIFRHNGNIISAFVFNPTNGILESNINLVPGQNTLEITATNACGADVKSTTLTYQNCVSPLISITDPNSPNQERNAPAYTVRARIDNITNANQVQFKVNGLLVTGGTFNPTTKIYSRAITLNEGGNTVEIVATNNCGSSSGLTTLIYKRPSAPAVQAPVINVSNPASCPVNVSPGNTSVSGTIQNVTAANQVSITVNGNPTIFTSSLVGNGLNFQLNLNAQANVSHYTISIVAVNQGGTANWSCMINVIQPVEEQKITICHYPPGNNGNPQTLEIPLSAWPAHQAHGDILGPCPVVTPEPVEEQKITICHYPPGNNGNPQTLEIPLSAWPAHQAHGDILGPCPPVNPGNGNQGGNGNSGNNGNQGGNNNNSGGGNGNSGNQGGNDNQGDGQPESNGGCLPTVGAVFTPNSITAMVTSSKDLSNVVLKFCDNTTQKFEGLTGYTGTFSGTGSNAGKCISGVWIKSGCNQSSDGPGYGEYVANNSLAPNCCVQDQGSSGCLPTVGATFDVSSMSVMVVSTKDLSNVVLKFCDNTTQKYDGLGGLSGAFAGSGQHAGKCIVGVWIKSGCNQSGDGPGYGEYVPNNNVAAGCCGQDSGGTQGTSGSGGSENNGQGGNAGSGGNGGRPGNNGGNQGGGNRSAKPAGTNSGTETPNNSPKPGTQQIPNPQETPQKGEGSGEGDKSARPAGKPGGGRGGN
jgi:hypothetical protein